MAREEGIVLRCDGQMAWVRTQRAGACRHCASRQDCGTVDGSSIEVEAVNLVSAAAGDRVELSCRSGPLLQVMFLLYLFPVLCLLAGAATGQAVSGALGLDPSVSAAVLGVAALGAALLVTRRVGQRWAGNTTYRVQVTKILARASVQRQIAG
jgi:sigma-E factor negative regulatory protein RseC